MHLEVLDDKQRELFPYLKSFQRSFYMAGGTAIALYIGHRRSVDFDLFSSAPLVKSRIRQKLKQMPFKQKTLYEDIDQLHILSGRVKITFLHYPYMIAHSFKLNSVLTLPDLKTLAAMKTYALGRRAKWKDYVDMYFLLKRYFSIRDICEECIKIFGEQFSEKIFREQLAFHKDIDYSEAVEYIGINPTDKEIREFLIDKAIDN
jgi:hypothetical protein